MGVFGVLSKVFMVLVLAVAVFVGYLMTFDVPIGQFFVIVFKLQGLGKPGTEEVPANLALAPRPAGEKFLPLPSGAKMPANGLGMCCRHTAYYDESAQRSIEWYVSQGGRHIDTADLYGNHRAIGRGIKAMEKRGVPRSELFVTTKIFPSHFGYNGTHRTVARFLEELGLEYLDLVLLHAPRNLSPRTLLNYKFGFDDEFVNYDCKNHRRCREETWRALSELQKQGKVRDVGVSNFKIEHIQELQALKLAPVAAQQLQYHPWAPKWQQDVVAYCKKHNIALTAYNSLGGLMKKHKALDVDGLKEIAKAHKRSTGQVLLRWALEKNFSVIPGTGNPKHMRENLDVYSFSLSEKEVARLDALSAHPVAEEFTFFDL